MTKLKPFLLALFAALAIAGVAHAATFTTAKTNAARAEALATPNASVFDLALGLRENDTDLVDESNSALAHSTCDGCRTVGIAFQVVIVQSTPSTVTPENVALAVNEGCTGCSSLAIAHQFVVGKGEPARITSRGASSCTPSATTSCASSAPTRISRTPRSRRGPMRTRPGSARSSTRSCARPATAAPSRATRTTGPSAAPPRRAPGRARGAGPTTLDRIRGCAYRGRLARLRIGQRPEGVGC